MADDDDPYAKFLKPSPGDAAPPVDAEDPYAKFLPKAAAPEAPAAPSTPWFSVGKGPDKIGEFVGKMADAYTGGLGAKALDALGVGQGPDGQTVAKQVESAGQDIGPLASAGADLAGYALGPGMLGVGEGLGKLATSQLARGIGENAASRVGGRMIGSGLEGAGATIVGAAGHDQDLTAGDLLKAAALSSAAGALPSTGGPKVSTPTTADLQAIAKPKFTPLENTWINGPNTGKEFSAVDRNITPGDRATMSSSLQNKVDDINQQISSNQVLSADDLAKFQRGLMKSARGPQDQLIAGKYVDALNTALGPHAPAVADANAATNVWKTSRDIDNWLQDPASAPKAVAAATNKRPQLYQSQPGLLDALKNIGQSQPTIWGKVGGKVGGALLNAAIDAGAEYLGGQNPITGAVAGGLSGLALGHGGAAIRAAPIRAKLLAAQHLNATGVPLPARSPLIGPLGSVLRQGVYGTAASGAF